MKEVDIMDFKRMVVPVVVSGLVYGVIQLIPFVSLLNCACCLLVILCGALAAYMYAKGGPIDNNEAVVVGALAGMLGGVVSSILGFILNMLLQMLGFGMGAMRGNDQLMAQLGVNAGVGVVAFLFTLVISLVLGLFFGAIGGVLFALFTNRQK